jgi:hypothetical protein
VRGAVGECGHNFKELRLKMWGRPRMIMIQR